MNRKEDDFHKRILDTFRVEAEEHIAAITSGLIELEKIQEPQAQKETIEAVFREAHSLKGAARAVNRTEIETACQEVESIFASLKENKITLTPGLFDTLHRSVDTLIRIHSTPESQRTPIQPSTPPRPLEEIERAEVPQESRAEPVSPRISQTLIPKLTETVRIPTAKLDAIFLQAEELLSAKLAAGRRARELREMRMDLASWNKRWRRILPDLRGMAPSTQENGKEKSPRLDKISDFLQWNSDLVVSVQNKLDGAEKMLKQDLRFLDTVVDNLLEEVKKALMLPFSSLLEMFPKFVRDLSRDRDKDVELVIRGGEIEIDRRILEKMKDPLIHLVRNCIDHGIERKAERRHRGKSPRGALTIDISQTEGGRVEVLVSDDGAGIDIEAVRRVGLRTGIISPDGVEKWTEEDALSLIFSSGVSTSPIVTDLSGRGLGLAIVLDEVERLGGAVGVQSKPSHGTAFRIVLPVTLATSRGILVRVGEHLFVIPMANVERVMRIDKSDVRTVENRETIHHDGRAFSLVRLGSVLGLNMSEAGDKDKIHVILLSAGDKRIAFSVDRVENEQEVLVKGMGRQLLRVRNIAAATVLGTGKMVLVLNVLDLMKSAVKELPAVSVPPIKDNGGEEKRKSVLVVEDSITARTLLKNILEAAGYDVRTAVDGLEAFTTLRTEPFDAVVSDVDMPRMNGFDLTDRIRHDRSLSELPVILVTALESRKDRERGIDVGANAYIVKSSFDQSNLLEVIKRLIG